MTSFLAALLVGSIQPSPNVLIQKPWVQLGEQRQKGSLAIVWQGPAAPRAFELEFSQRGEDRRAPFSSRLIDLVKVEQHRVYRATLEGLLPGEPITYRLKLDGKTLFRGEVVAPKSDRQATRFVVFGDCGIGLPPQVQVATQIYAQRPDMVMITGDIVYDEGEINEYRSRFFPYYATDRLPLLSSSLIVGVPGNHDILGKDFNEAADSLAYYYYWNQPLNGPVKDVKDKNATPFKATDEARAAFLKTAGPSFPRMANFSFDYGNAHWLCLDANPYVDWSEPRLRKWVIDDLKKSKKTWKFVAFHHPGFHSSPTHQAQKQMRRAADLFEDGGVDVVFAGHVHNYQRSFPIQVGPKRGASEEELAKDDWPVDRSFDGRSNTRPKGVIYIVDGAGGARLYDAVLNDKPSEWKPFQAQYVVDYSFSLVELAGRKFSLVQIDKDGKERDRFVVTK